MSTGVFYIVAAAGVGFAIAVAFVGVRALRSSKTVEVFEQKPQEYMLQVHPPGHKVQAMGLPMRRESDREQAREKQA
jgi:hypothetical protein